MAPGKRCDDLLSFHEAAFSRRLLAGGRSMKWPAWLILIFGLVLGVIIGLMLAPWRIGGDDGQPALWLEVLHRVLTSVGGLGTFVALLFVVRQFNLIRAQSDLVQKNTRASMDAQLYSRLDSFNKFVVEHDKEYDLLDVPLEKQAPEHSSKLHRMCDLGFTFFEEIYKHHQRYDLLETEDWEEWQQNMVHFFKKAYVRDYWKTVTSRYAKSFQAFAGDLVARLGGEVKG
jgi:hypothetical protein